MPSLFKLGLAQCSHVQGNTWQDALRTAEIWSAKALAEGVDLLVFPEAFMTRYDTEKPELFDKPQLLDGPFCSAMNALAQRFGIWLIYTMLEFSVEGKPFNTACIVSSEGIQQGVYRKTHLFDTEFICESDHISKGDRLFEPLNTPFGKLGLGICYDLRFPELVRTAALLGCELFLLPAAWFDGEYKLDQWKTLLKARAIENGMFVAGVCSTDANRVGHSLIVDPQGNVLAEGGEKDELVVAEINLSAIQEVRARLPLLSHRHPELYTVS